MFAAVLAFAALAAGAQNPQSCKVLLQAKQLGDPVFFDRVAPAPCPVKKVEARLRYDARRHIVTAREAMIAGTELGLAYVPRRPAVAAGEAVRIDATVGHVSVMRTATALEPAEYGQRFHVRTADGLVLRAPPLMAQRVEDQKQP
ncbi:MAG: hypothetical protein J0M19_12600 [Sphingomonadales bacterium]|nr:hypothetical protein [Sphingomonadales bacterium]